jgi:hemerythrin superfamily protein
MEDRMNATELLEKQHRKVEAIFAKLEDEEKPSDAKELLVELANDLAAHMTIEQELFYPAVRAVDSELVAESLEEHALAEVALKRLLAAHSAEAFKARVTALKELIEHHVKEEEEELFPKVDKALDDEKLEALGEEMEARFDEVVDAGYKKVLPKGEVLTSADASQSHKKPAPRSKKAPATRRKSAA